MAESEAVPARDALGEAERWARELSAELASAAQREPSVPWAPAEYARLAALCVAESRARDALEAAENGSEPYYCWDDEDCPTCNACADASDAYIAAVSARRAAMREGAANAQ